MIGFYAASGIVLGAWEAIAKGTGRIPTVSRTAARTRSTRVIAAAWSVGLAHHFLTYRAE